jgi:hypothetical protein
MGLLGLSFGLAFVVGPALGGTLASKFDSLTAPLVAAAVLCGVNACLLTFLPESHSRSPVPASTSTSSSTPAEKPNAFSILQLDSVFQRWRLRSTPEINSEGCKTIDHLSKAARTERATLGNGFNRSTETEEASTMEMPLQNLKKQAKQHAACLRNLLLSKLAFNLAKGSYESLFTQHLRRRFGSNDSEVSSCAASLFS